VSRILSTGDLFASERRFLAALDDIPFGRFEHMRIENGQLVLDPWPTIVRGVKFGTETPTPPTSSGEFDLKRQVVEFFEYVRAVEEGEIRCLEVKHSLPFSMEVSQHPRPINGGKRG
jgi:hypothetical protein